MTMPPPPPTPPPLYPTAPPPLDNPHAWELVTSPGNVFTVVVPRGWFRDLQQRQTGPASVVRWAVTGSPDGATTIITADPDIPDFVAPGAPARPGAAVMAAAPAEQWAQNYLTFNLGQKPDFRITHQAASQSTQTHMRALREDGAINFTWDSAAEVSATYTEGDVTRSVAVIAWTGGGDFGEWTARAIRVLSSGDARAFVPAALKITHSLELTPGERLRQGFGGENAAWLGAWGKKAARGLNKAVEDIGGNRQQPPRPPQPPGDQPRT